MGNTPVLFDIRNPDKHFHRQHTFVWNLRVLNEISTWETLLIQIFSCLKPLKIIGINPCKLNIGFRYFGKTTERISCCLTDSYSILTENESRVKSGITFWCDRHNQRPADRVFHLTIQIPGTHAGRTPVIPTGISLN
jgi:hypothetical protein